MSGWGWAWASSRRWRSTRARDHDLRQLDSAHLFPENVARIAVRRGHYLRRYAYRFIELCAAELTEAKVTQALRNDAEAEAF